MSDLIEAIENIGNIGRIVIHDSLLLFIYFYLATIIQRYFNFSMEVLMLTGIFVLFFLNK